MSDKDTDWKEMLALAAIILAVAVGCSTCNYVDHRIELEKKEMKK